MRPHLPWRFLLLMALCCAAAPALADEWFAPFAQVADYKPKGPTHCYRHFNFDWDWVAVRPDQLPLFLSKADPAVFAEFCRQTHIDGTIVMAVPHHGYCSYETRVGQKFPGMKGDWFGRTIDELHKRHIAAFGYVTMNWNWKYMREHWGKDFIHGKFESPGVFGHSGIICLNAPGYLDLVEGYTREVMENYPVDGMRWDILETARGCQCTGCKRLYRQLYGEDLVDWESVADRRRVDDFYLATTNRAVNRLYKLCKEIKPSVEIWNNNIQNQHPIDLDLGRKMDIAYNEFADPFRLLSIRGITNKAAAINGLMNQLPTDPPLAIDHGQWRLCLALGGRCYSYYGHLHADPTTVMPGPEMFAWHRQQLAPFYSMVAQIQPWLEGALPVSQVGIVYCERTRYRYPRYNRKAYIAPMQAITSAAYLKRSLPLEFVNALDLGDPQKRLSRLKLLVLPLTSGLQPEELQQLRQYVAQGGNLLVAGDALRHDARGLPQPDFALAGEMGVSYLGAIAAKDDLPVAEELRDSPTPQRAGIRNVVRTRPSAGQTLLSVPCQDGSCPLLHVNNLGQGKIVYLASLDSLELTQQVVDWLAGPPPLVVVGNQHKQAILTCQPRQQRWILHLISDGDYRIDINRSLVSAHRVIEQYPASGWDYRATPTDTGLRVEVHGGTSDRLLVLE